MPGAAIRVRIADRFLPIAFVRCSMPRIIKFNGTLTANPTRTGAEPYPAPKEVSLRH